MEPDLIDAYVDELRRSLARNRRAADVVAEVEDHLRESARRLSGHGVDAVTAQRHTIDRFGDLRVVTRAFATDAGGLAMATPFTRAAGAIGYLAVALWLLAAAARGLDYFVVPESDTRMYAAVSVLAALATIATAVTIAGMLVRSGGVRGVAALIALAAMVLAALMMATAPWAWVFTAVPLTAAAIIAVWRMRAVGMGGRWADLSLVLAWPAGVLLTVVGEAIRIGPRDYYGDYPWAFLAGLVVALLLYCAGLVGVSLRLRTEQPVGEAAVAGSPA
ncbi:MAG: hypothetical protein Q7V58_10110 [Actinomycetota bacterium]|nr:hypothetical protein [Actinomycetota bacterium]